MRQTRTRYALLSAARGMMAEGSRISFTIDELVQAAGVAKGSFYNHFADKEAVATEVQRAVLEMEEVEVGAVNRDVSDPVARIARGMAVYARLAVSKPDDARILTLNQIGGGFLESAVNSGLATDLRSALRVGHIIVPSIDAAAMLVVGQVAVLMSRLIDPISHPLASLITKQCLALTLAGLGVPRPEADRHASQAVETILRF